jgi:hypothetical protein
MEDLANSTDRKQLDLLEVDIDPNLDGPGDVVLRIPGQKAPVLLTSEGAKQAGLLLIEASTALRVIEA